MTELRPTFPELPGRRRVVVVVGTRPEAIKMFPVIHALQESEVIVPYVVTTGQHTDMVDDVLRLAGIEPDAQLEVVRDSGTINELATQVMGSIGRMLADLARDHTDPWPAVIGTMVHGDTTSAMAAALASAQAGIPVVHVEAGLRTYNPLGPFPEELNRQVISRVALVQIAPTMDNEANLIREMIDDTHVFVSGNTSIDALQWATRQAPGWTYPDVGLLAESGEPFIVATLHRRENWPHLADMASAINRITEARPDVKVVLPMHPNPAVQQILHDVLDSNPNVILVEALGYIEFAHLLAAATFAISDSGGIQEEAPSVGTPVLVAREETERQEGVDAGTLLLVGVDPDVIFANALALLNEPERLAAMQNAANPFGDGRAAERIKRLAEYLVEGGAPPRAFGSGVNRASILRAAGYQDRAIVPELTEEQVDEALAEWIASPGHITPRR